MAEIRISTGVPNPLESCLACMTVLLGAASRCVQALMLGQARGGDGPQGLGAGPTFFLEISWAGLADGMEVGGDGNLENET